MAYLRPYDFGPPRSDDFCAALREVQQLLRTHPRFPLAGDFTICELPLEMAACILIQTTRANSVCYSRLRVDPALYFGDLWALVGETAAAAYDECEAHRVYHYSSLWC